VPCPDQLHVEVLNDEIGVILPATSYGVVYYKPANSTQLLVRNFLVEGPSPRRSFSLEPCRPPVPKRVSLVGLCERNEIRAARGRKAGLPHVGRLITG
jgi:hypothetical protein